MISKKNKISKTLYHNQIYHLYINIFFSKFCKLYKTKVFLFQGRQSFRHNGIIFMTFFFKKDIKKDRIKEKLK